MQNRVRKKTIAIRVTEDEYALVKEKMNLLGMKNMSAYARKMLIDGMIIEVNNQSFDDVAKEINLIGRNINQVVKRINISKDAKTADIEELKGYQKKIWQLLRSIR